MTTSNITEFESTGANIVKHAFQHIRVTQKGQALSADDMQIGIEYLNGLIKSWQRDGLHLWKNKEAAVFLEVGRKKYTLGAQASIACDDEGCRADDIVGDYVHATSGDWVVTSLVSGEPAGNDVVNIASWTSYDGIEYSTACSMNIGIQNINGGMDWYSVAAVDGFEVALNDVLINEVEENATVFVYRENDQLEKPLKIYQENVRLYQIDNNYELPLHLLSYTEYSLLPCKNTKGTPVQAYYEPKINNTELSLWPTSRTVSSTLLFRFQSPIEVFDSDTDTQDFPDEWIRPLEWALAAELGATYGLPPQRQMMLDQKASALKTEVEAWDQDNTSLFLHPAEEY